MPRSLYVPDSPFQIAFDELYSLGIVLEKAPGEYRLNYFKGGTAATAQTTDDLNDALRQGREMAANPPTASLPPLGPTGARSTRRGAMYKHNRALAAKRRRRAAKGKM